MHRYDTLIVVDKVINHFKNLAVERQAEP